MDERSALMVVQREVDAALSSYVESLAVTGDDEAGPGPVVAWVCLALRYNDGSSEPGMNILVPDGQLWPLTRGLLDDAVHHSRHYYTDPE